MAPLTIALCGSRHAPQDYTRLPRAGGSTAPNDHTSPHFFLFADDLRVRALKGTLTPQVVDIVRARKPELLEALNAKKEDGLADAESLLGELLERA